MTEKITLKTSVFKVALITLGLLLIPFTANLLTDEVNWSNSDFLIAGMALFVTGTGYVFIRTKSSNIIYRIATGLALFTALFLLWANGAVGLIGSENNDINMIYFGVFLIFVIGMVFSGFKAPKMAIASAITAVAQASTIVIALLMDAHHLPYSSISEIILVNLFFVTLFSISAGLFWQVESKSEIEEPYS